MTSTTTPEPGPRPIDLRIVVDGASTAGKTTTARSLGERLGRPVVTPEEHDGRTLLFDWMDHEGGRSDGRPIRTQVVAVPGHLLHLRARLLVTADVVLFVADTSASGMHASEVALAQVRTLLDAYEGVRPGLVIQANKRDADDALPIDEVTERLTREGDDPIIETVALTGEGVRQSYVYAVRLGLIHARAVDGPRIAERQMTADALLRELDRDPRPIREVTPTTAEAGDRSEPTAGPDEAANAPGSGPDPAPEAEVEAEVEVEVEVELDVDAQGEAPIEAPRAAVPAPMVEAVEEAASTVAEPAPAPDPIADPHGRELAPVGAGSPGAGSAPDGLSVGAIDRPEHDHPRAWRRWFDR